MCIRDSNLPRNPGREWNRYLIHKYFVFEYLISLYLIPVSYTHLNPEIMREESEQRKRVSHKLKLCPEEYLPIIEVAIDGALKMEQTAKQKEDARCV